MDITRDNFEEKLPWIIKSINTADFMAFDAEFSGLNIGETDKKFEFDDLDTRY